MMKIKEAIVVEGRYDKNTLSQLVDGVILETSGGGSFKARLIDCVGYMVERLALPRRLAGQRGIIVLTDSDGAGFVIRNFLKGALPAGQVKHAYIPDQYGKERRKRAPGKAGKLGVEGMRPEVLERALRRAGATVLEEGKGEARRQPRREITKADLFALGLSGAPGATQRRQALLRSLALPEHLSANALLPVLNALYSYEEFASATAGCESSGHAW